MYLSHERFLTAARKFVWRRFNQGRKVTIDDVRRYFISRDEAPVSPALWGQVFRGSWAKFYGKQRSTIKENHGRFITIWERA